MNATKYVGNGNIRDIIKYSSRWTSFICVNTLLRPWSWLSIDRLVNFHWKVLQRANFCVIVRLHPFSIIRKSTACQEKIIPVKPSFPTKGECFWTRNIYQYNEWKFQNQANGMKKVFCCFYLTIQSKIQARLRCNFKYKLTGKLTGLRFTLCKVFVMLLNIF